MYPLILPAVSKNIIDKGRKSICVTVSLRTYMYSQLIYLRFGDRRAAKQKMIGAQLNKMAAFRYPRLCCLTKTAK